LLAQVKIESAVNTSIESQKVGAERTDARIVDLERTVNEMTAEKRELRAQLKQLITVLMPKPAQSPVAESETRAELLSKLA
jgi:hypothetical protein